MNTPSQVSSTAPLPAAPCVPATVDSGSWLANAVHDHESHLKAWLRKQYPTVRSDVDDVVQESFLRLWRRRAGRPIESVKSFLFASARNAAIDLIRRDRRSPIDRAIDIGSLPVSRVMDGRADAADALTAEEKFKLLSDAVAHLPERSYQVIMLHKIDGLSQREVAARLGIAEHTVANHVQLATRRCEKFLRKRGVSSIWG